MSSKYLVTGGAGFIGSHITEALVKQGDTVRVLDNLSTGKPENLAAFRGDIELVEGDLRDMETVRKAAQGMDCILHQGALPSVPVSVEDPIGTNDCNVAGTVNVLVAARDANVRRVVYAASSAAYGNNPDLPKIETMRTELLSPYAIQKYVGELYCRNFYELYGLETVALRYFNVFGPRQDPTSQYAAVLPLFITALARGKAPVVYGDGEQTRDFIFVEDVVQANLAATRAENVAGETMNCATGRGFSLNKILDLLRGLMETDLQAVYEAPRQGDVKHSVADIGKIQQRMNFTPSVSFEEGLRRTIAFFRPEAG